MTILKDELRELAERVEAATGPDRELDMLAWIVRHGEPENDRIEGSRGSRLIRRGGTRGGVCHPVGKVVALEHQALVPRYTASLDAAMQLVEAADASDIFREALNRLGKAHALHIRRWRDGDGDYSQCLARFVTAAALRVRADAVPTQPGVK